MVSRDSALILFTLSPEAEGKRKPLGLGGPDRAARVFAALLDHLKTVCNSLSGVDLLVATPPGHRTGTYPAREEHHLPQRGASFGESLRLAVEDAFSLGYRRVVVIGNDAPEMSRSYIENAFERLGDPRPTAVLGPSRDGGYALLGLTAPCPAAFCGVRWGSSRVARTTTMRLLQSGFIVSRLETLEDIDDRRGLTRFLLRARRSVAELAELARHILQLLSPRPALARLSHHRAWDLLLFSCLGFRAPPVAV